MLTDEDVYRYIVCPHWPYWERFGNRKDRRRLSTDEEARLGDRLEAERSLAKRCFLSMTEVRLSDPTRGTARTLALMHAGTEVIYRGWLMADRWAARPDILLKTQGKSVFGSWHYVPWIFRRGHELKKEYKFPLVLDAMLLEQLQNRFPREPGVINADGRRLPFDASELVVDWQNIKHALERIADGELPDPVYRKSCDDTSPWDKACFRLASERNDIALLFNVDLKKLHALRTLGIRTVDDAAEMDPARWEGQSAGLTLRALQSVQRQAVSLRDQSVIIREPFTHPSEGCEIHFDIESYPPTDTDYLYGFWFQGVDGGAYHAFTAETPQDEEKMWKSFLAWITTLPSMYTVYHYANYEPTRLRILAERYGDEKNPWLEKFISRMVDLKESAREHAVFPLYFYSLKKICQFLGFEWKGSVKSGGESVGVYKKWLQTKRRSILDSLLRYNQDDVEATAFLLTWLRNFARVKTVFARPYPWRKKS